jgi:hypothetical protein
MQGRRGQEPHKGNTESLPGMKDTDKAFRVKESWGCSGRMKDETKIRARRRNIFALTERK